MIIKLFFLLLLCTAVLAWRQRTRLTWFFSGVMLLLFLLIGCGPIPYLLLARLQEPSASSPTLNWSARNTIVLLGTGTQWSSHIDSWQPSTSTFAYSRIVKAAELYYSCKTESNRSCLLLISGGDSQAHHVAEATVYSHTLQKLGIPLRNLLLEPHSRNTWENAKFSRQLLEKQTPQRLFLVTSNFHLHRSLLYFRHFGMQPIAIGSGEPNVRISWWPRWQNFFLCKVALHEYHEIMRYYIYNFFGWNKPALSPLDKTSR